MKNISVLFVRKNSIYKSIPNCDCYDIDRDALTCINNYPVIAHPPCAPWGRLRKQAIINTDIKNYAIFSINMVRKYGGIVEHPSSSTLWQHMNLPTGKHIDEYGGWTLSINQSWFGHLAEKKTWLYIVGCSPSDIPQYPILLNAITHVISSSKKHTGKKECSKKMREETPILLAKYLVDLAMQLKK